MQKNLVAIGAILGFLAVALGAFGTHGLRGKLDERSMEVWQTAVHYHLAHAVAILVCALLMERFPRARLSGWLMTGGVVVFAGTLYAYALSGVTAFAIVTPIGGALFLAGWAWLAVAAIKGT